MKILSILILLILICSGDLVTQTIITNSLGEKISLKPNEIYWDINSKRLLGDNFIYNLNDIIVEGSGNITITTITDPIIYYLLPVSKLSDKVIDLTDYDLRKYSGKITKPPVSCDKEILFDAEVKKNGDMMELYNYESKWIAIKDQKELLHYLKPKIYVNDGSFTFDLLNFANFKYNYDHWGPVLNQDIEIYGIVYTDDEYQIEKIYNLNPIAFKTLLNLEFVSILDLLIPFDIKSLVNNYDVNLDNLYIQIQSGKLEIISNKMIAEGEYSSGDILKNILSVWENFGKELTITKKSDNKKVSDALDKALTIVSKEIEAKEKASEVAAKKVAEEVAEDVTKKATSSVVKKKFAEKFLVNFVKIMKGANYIQLAKSIIDNAGPVILESSNKIEALKGNSYFDTYPYYSFLFNCKYDFLSDLTEINKLINLKDHIIRCYGNTSSIEIDGFTDSYANNWYNEQLSLRRAFSLDFLLMEQLRVVYGVIDPNRLKSFSDLIKVKYFGEKRLKEINDKNDIEFGCGDDKSLGTTNWKSRLNRRVEVRVK